MTIEVTTHVLSKEQISLRITVPLGVQTYTYIDTLVKRWVDAGYEPGDVTRVRNNVFDVTVERNVAKHLMDTIPKAYLRYKDLDDYDNTVIQPALGKTPPNIFKGTPLTPGVEVVRIEATHRDGAIDILENDNKGWFNTTTGKPADMNDYIKFETLTPRPKSNNFEPPLFHNNFTVPDYDPSVETVLTDELKEKLIKTGKGFQQTIINAQTAGAKPTPLTPKDIDDLCP